MTTIILTSPSKTTNSVDLNFYCDTALTSEQPGRYEIYQDGSIIQYINNITDFQAPQNITRNFLGPDITFTFQVKAFIYDASTQAVTLNAANSNLLSVHTYALLEPITGLNASSIHDNNFILNWDAVTGATSYDIFKDGTIYGSSNSNSLSITGLAPNTSYAMTVQAKNNNSANNGYAESSDISTPLNVNTLPSPPTNLTITDNIYGSCMLSWTAPAGGAPYGYNIDVNSAVSGRPNGFPLLYKMETSQKIEWLRASKPNGEGHYTITVWSVGGGGNEQILSEPASIDVITPPVNINISSSFIGTNDLRIAWSIDSGFVTEKFLLTNPYVEIPFVSGQVNYSYDAMDLPEGQFSTYIIAKSGVNESLVFDGMSSSIGAGIPITAPVNIVATNISITGFDLSWDATLSAVSYEVYVDGNLIDSPTTNSSSITDLIPNTTYNITVKAIGTTTTATSAPIQVTTLEFFPPVNIVATNISVTGFDLSWDVVANATSYEVYVDGNLVDSPTTNSSNITNLTSGTTYNISIKSIMNSASSSLSDIVQVTTLMAVLSDFSFDYNNELNTITLSWNDEGAEKYQILYKTDYAGGYTGTGLTLDEAGTQPADSPIEVTGTSVVLYNAIVDTTYWFAMQTMNGGTWGNIVEKTTNVTPTVSGAANTGLPAPSDVTMTINQSTKEITLNWIQE